MKLIVTTIIADGKQSWTTSYWTLKKCAELEFNNISIRLNNLES